MQPMSFDPHQDPVDVHRDGVDDHQNREDHVDTSRSVLPTLVAAAIIVMLVFVLFAVTRLEPSTVPTSTEITTTIGL